MTRIEINFHLKQLQKDYKSVSDRDLSFEEWMTAQILAVTSQMARVVSGLEAVNSDLGEANNKLIGRACALEEWLTEYRDQLKKENAFHKNTGIINAINELLNENSI